jgi:hypothetical protein
MDWISSAHEGDPQGIRSERENRTMSYFAIDS